LSVPAQIQTPVVIGGVGLLLLILLGVIAFVVVIGVVIWLLPIILMFLGLYLALFKQRLQLGGIVFIAGVILFVLR
jgi:hypothetical protein